MPFVLVRDSFRSGQSDVALLLVGVSDVCLIEVYRLAYQYGPLSAVRDLIMPSLTSFESILILSAWLVGNFDATPALVGVFKKIDIRALVKPVMSGFHSIGAIEVMNVCEASLTVCQQIGTSPQRI